MSPTPIIDDDFYVDWSSLVKKYTKPPPSPFKIGDIVKVIEVYQNGPPIGSRGVIVGTEPSGMHRYAVDFAPFSSKDPESPFYIDCLHKCADTLPSPTGYYIPRQYLQLFVYNDGLDNWV